jgi:hypothetical protein
MFGKSPLQHSAAFEGDGATSHGEMTLHSKMLECKKKDVLKHPLSETFLQLKYRLIRPLFLINLILFSLFTVVLTVLAVMSTYHEQHCAHNQNITSICFALDENPEHKHVFFAFYAMTAATVALLLAREVVQGRNSPNS